jgi:predicted TIM-barrel fold metal-dependent hydrolase
MMYRGDADGLIEVKDAMGVQTTAVMSWVGPIGSDPLESNDIVARACERHPGRFLGVCYVNPVLLSPEEQMAEVRRRVEGQGFVALKPYVRTGLRYDDPLYQPCWEYADARGLYVLVHTGGPAGEMDMVAALARRYPAAQWVVAHSGGSFAMARSVAAVMKQCPNVWAELTLTPVTNGVIEWMVGEVGDDRILFGTDAPMRDPRPQFGWVVWSDLPVESRRRILGENFRRLLAMRKP